MTASVLWLTPRADPRQRAGGDIRTVQLVKALAQHITVDVLVVGYPRVDAEELEAVTGARSVRWLPGNEGVRLRALAVRRRWPIAVASMWSRSAQEAVASSVSHGSVIVADFIQSAVYAPAGPYVLDLHNAESVRLAEVPVSSSLRARLENAWERRAMSRWESSAVNDPRARVVTVSADDAGLLGVAAVVVPNGSSLQAPRATPADGCLLFVGSLDYGPNVEAVRWWARSIWPLLDRKIALRVVGRGGAPALGDLVGHPAVDVVGEVADLTPHLLDASMIVVPLRHGGGSRLKVLEALAWSIPVVSTTKGVEGLDLAVGSEVVVADEPAELAAAVDQLMSDHDRRTAMGAAGRAAAERFSWPVVAGRLLEVIESTRRELERAGPP